MPAPRKTEPARERPAVPAAPSPAPGRSPQVETDGRALDALATSTATASPPIPVAEGISPASAEDARRLAEQLRAETQALPGQAARAHGNLVPATVLNLLA
jgi:hypothetical protein